MTRIVTLAAAWLLVMGSAGIAQFDPRPFPPAPPPPQALPGGQLPSLADGLVAEAGRFVEEVRYELAGTRQGRNLEIRGNALLGVAEGYRAEVLARHGDEARRIRAFEGVERALAEVQRELNNPPGTAPRAAATARRVDRLANEIRRIYGGAMPGPIGPAPGPPSGGYDAGRLVRFADAAAVNTNALIDRIGREIGPIYPYDAVVRDLQAVSYNLDAFGRTVQRRPPLARAQASFQPILNQARQAGMALESARPPGPIARLWAEVRQSLDTMTDLLGLGGDFVIDYDRPVLLDPPGFEHLPWPIRPPGPVGPPPALPLIDQAVGELEAYLLAIRPNLASIPEGPRFHRDARNLRDALLALRQPLAAGAWDPGAARAFSRVESDTRSLVDRTLRVARGQIGPNNARVLRVRDLVDQIRGLLPQF